MSLAQNILTDANRVFTNPSEFAEAVVVNPGLGTPYTINAQVRRRSPVEIAPGRGGTSAWRMLVRCSTDPVLGIPPATLDLGTWTMTIAAEVGDTPKPRQILKVIDQDLGMILLAVQ
jgi:hypothetical protein